MRSGLRWMLLLTGVGAAVAVLLWGFRIGQRERAAEAVSEAPIRPPMRVRSDSTGRPVVAIPAAMARRIGLTTSATRAVKRLPPVIAYGTLIADPAARFTLRAPRRGVLRCPHWPRLGQMLPEATDLGRIEPALEVPAWADLSARLAEAEAAVAVHTARLAAAKASFENKLRLRSSQGLGSQRAVEQARAEVQAEQAELRAAKQKASMLRALVAPASQPAAALPLRLPRGGQVVAIEARPGELVEAGQALLELGRFDTLVAEVELPLGESLPTPPEEVRLRVPAASGGLRPASVIGLAPQGPGPHGQRWWLRVPNPRHDLRPGFFVVAELQRAETGSQAVELPSDAVVRALGRTWVYVEIGPERYRRQPVTLRAPAPRGWIAIGAVAPGQQVVTRAAALLLSEELKERIRVGEEAQ